MSFQGVRGVTSDGALGAAPQPIKTNSTNTRNKVRIGDIENIAALPKFGLIVQRMSSHRTLQLSCRLQKQYSVGSMGSMKNRHVPPRASGQLQRLVGPAPHWVVVATYAAWCRYVPSACNATVHGWPAIGHRYARCVHGACPPLSPLPYAPKLRVATASTPPRGPHVRP